MRVLLRDLTGTDEVVGADGDAAAASRLIERLVARINDTAGHVDTASLSVFEHDRLLTAIFTRLYGAKADCHATCTACAEAFEFQLPLDRILAEQDAEARRWGEPDAEGWWIADGGVAFRAPTANEAMVTDFDSLRVLCLKGDASGSFDLDAALASASPTMSVDVAVTCPQCEAKQTARFDVARHLAKSLQRELPFLQREVHLIAATYGWGHAEIMGLTRQTRHVFAGLIASGRTAQSAPRKAS